jgi:hypothetical protein
MACLLLAAGSVPAQGIYTCIDSQGRKLTSDRPIAECVDREQQELNPSGTVKRRIGPNLTATERAAQEAREKKAAGERARLAEQKRRDRALLIRYPTQAVHDKERAEALHQVDEVIKAAQKRLTQLDREHQVIEAELEFYKKDPARAPRDLLRRKEDTLRSMEVQKRFMLTQEEEKKRINTRFDLDLAKLRQLWALAAPAAYVPEPAGPVPTR